MRPSLERALREAYRRGMVRRVRNGARAATAEALHARRDAALSRATLAQDARWALAQAYYAVFHALNAVLMLHGYRERGHAALAQVATEYLAPAGVLTRADAAAFAALRVWRERAMYELECSPAQAEEAVELATRLVESLGLPPETED